MWMSDLFDEGVAHLNELEWAHLYCVIVGILQSWNVYCSKKTLSCMKILCILCEGLDISIVVFVAVTKLVSFQVLLVQSHHSRFEYLK